MKQEMNSLHFRGHKGYLTREVCVMVFIISNKKIYNYAKKSYQDTIKDISLKLVQGEDYFELTGEELIEFKRENPDFKLNNRQKLLRFWLDSGVRKIRCYKRRDESEREKLKVPVLYRRNLTDSYQFQYLSNELAKLKNDNDLLNLKVLTLEKAFKKEFKDISELIKAYLLLKRG